MYTLTVQNKYGEQLELTHNEAYVIESIDGIDPPEAVINTTRNANADGSVFNSAYVDNRQITITLAINGPAEANRINLYRYFKARYPITLYYTNATRDVYINGYVKNVQIGFFQKKQIAQITILCPDPYFKGVMDEIVDFASVEDLFEFPFSIEEEYNLLPNTMTTQTIGGITFTVNDDGTIEASGTSTDYTWSAYVNESGVSLPAGSYVLSGCPEGGSSTTYRLQAIAGDPSSPTLTVNDYGGGASFELTETTIIKVRMLIKGTINATFSPMIYEREDIEYGTASGNTVSISDGSDNALVECATNIEPVQDLHGYSKPWAGGAGKNKLPNTGSTTVTPQGITFTVNSDGSVTANGTASGTATFRMVTTTDVFKLPAGSYIISGGQRSNRAIGFKTLDGTTQYNNSGDTSFTLNEETTWDYIFIRIASGEVLDNVTFYPMIRTSGDSTWEPYSNICPISGHTDVNIFVDEDGTSETPAVTVDLNGTIYGGTLNVNTGELTVNKVGITLNGSEQWNYTAPNVYSHYVGTNIVNFTAIFDRFKSVNKPYTSIVEGEALNYIGYITIYKPSRYNTMSEYINDIGNIQVIYELATPQTYQLTPEEVRTLVGQNTIKSDTGNISIKYIAFADVDRPYQEYDTGGKIEFSEIVIQDERDLINNGDVETGLIIQIQAMGPLENPVIYNAETQEYFKLNISMTRGDEVYINTNKKHKTVELTANGATTNIIGNLANGSTWLTLTPGDNLFAATALTNPQYLEIVCILTDQYEGV